MSSSHALPSKGIITTGIAVLVVLVLGFSLFGTFNSVQKEGKGQENRLEAQYKANQNELSTYILQFKESLGVADKGTAKLDVVLSNAIAGRYDGAMEPGSGGELYSAITEAYPDLTATTESYAKVQDLVVSGRAEFRNQQNKLSNMISTYETWMDSGLIQSKIVKMSGFPSDSLEARIGNDVYKGEEALEKMKQQVLAEEAVTSFETGTTAPLIEPDEG